MLEASEDLFDNSSRKARNSASIDIKRSRTSSDSLDLMLAGVPDRRLRWLVNFIEVESPTSDSMLGEAGMADEATAAWLAACKAEAEIGGVADRELELSQDFSSMTRAGDLSSILGNDVTEEVNFLLLLPLPDVVVNSISREFDPGPGAGGATTASFRRASRSSARFLCNSSSFDSKRR